MAENKEKRYVSDNAQLMAEWDWEKNSELGFNPNQLTQQSNKKVWWKCSKGHEWQTRVSHRYRGLGCPYCSGRKALTGITDLATVNPKLAAEWHPSKNGLNITPQTVLPGCSKKVWWRCDKGHEWQAQISSRTRGNGCPYCSGHLAIHGETDLVSTHPEIAEEWHPTKNGELTPNDITFGSNKKVWWLCENGHEWYAAISNRALGTGCPYCSGRLAIKGKSDLKTIYPKLAEEWNYEKNGNLLPENVTSRSGKRVWWRCVKGHEWQSTIHNRVASNGCPLCSSELQTSFPEFAIIYYLRQQGLDAIQSYGELGYELDIYLPTLKIGIEYDGYFWHKNSINKDLNKNSKCKNDGIILYRIREELPVLNDYSIDYVVQRNKVDLSKVIKKLLYKICKLDIDVDVQRDSSEIENTREYLTKKGSLLIQCPEIAEEWNYEKNGKLRPEHVKPNSNKKVWWRCAKSHEWVATVNHRYAGTGCPYCSGRTLQKGVNDLATINPPLANEWNYDRNGELLPSDVFPNSNKKVWWKCSKGHEWESTILNRNLGNGCPICARIREKREIINLNTGEVFSSCSDAERKLGVSRKTISVCCKGKCKTAGGYHWAYYDKKVKK